MTQQEPIQAGPLPRDLLHALRDGGYDVSGLAPAPESDTDSDPSDLRPTVPAAGPQQACNVLCAVYRATGDPTIGLWLGSRMQTDLLGLAGLPAMAGPSLGTALRRIARYQKLLAGDRIELRRQGDEAWVCIRPSDPEAPDTRPRIDMELCSLLAFGRSSRASRCIRCGCRCASASRTGTCAIPRHSTARCALASRKTPSCSAAATWPCAWLPCAQRTGRPRHGPRHARSAAGVRFA